MKNILLLLVLGLSYPPLEEEELESIEAPIQTEEMEQQPLIK